MEWLYQCFAAILSIWILYRLARRKRLPPATDSATEDDGEEKKDDARRRETNKRILKNLRTDKYDAVIAEFKRAAIAKHVS